MIYTQYCNSLWHGCLECCYVFWNFFTVNRGEYRKGWGWGGDLCWSWSAAAVWFHRRPSTDSLVEIRWKSVRCCQLMHSVMQESSGGGAQVWRVALGRESSQTCSAGANNVISCSNWWRLPVSCSAEPLGNPPSSSQTSLQEKESSDQFKIEN